MKTIGIIGGMSWKSSLEYYKLINELVHKKLGGWHSAKIIMYSVDFDEIDLEHKTKKWKKSDEILFDAAKSLEKSGADYIIIGANTAHILADKIQEKIKIPILHIVDSTAERIKSKKINVVGLLGTKLTMQDKFYKGRLEEKYNIKVIVPEKIDQEKINLEINNIILGKNNQRAKKEIISIINKLKEKGAKAIILGCTELPLIIKQSDVKIPLFDTMKIHVEKAVSFCLKK
ncbi:MAG TPA: aspartate/glutamate racemase family protein [bacterium]|nr:aspartate/glutamate racemase family protein [bacterium]